MLEKRWEPRAPTFFLFYMRITMPTERIDERFLQNIWRQIHHLSPVLPLSEGGYVRVINPGSLNQHDGPDFLNAQLEFGGGTWYGNVEIHLRASDWERHGHSSDPRYKSVILHVVMTDDRAVRTADGLRVKTATIPHLDALEQRLDSLFTQAQTPRCGGTLQRLHPLKRQAWLERLATQRFESKAQGLQNQANSLAMGWEEVLYQSLMRSFGLKANAASMAELAERTPLQIVIKNRDSQTKLEAILLGQAGFLQGQEHKAPHDSYLQELIGEYAYQQKKYKLSPMQNPGWKFMRIRPPAFPTIRISQICTLYRLQPQLMSRILECTSVTQISELFTLRASSYWNSHYTLGTPSQEHTIKRTGKQLIQSIVINTIIPFQYAWGGYTGNERLMQQATDLLESLPPEDNSTSRAFEAHGIRCQNAYDSQALSELKKEYCDTLQCVLCPAGLEIVQRILQNDTDDSNKETPM